MGVKLACFPRGVTLDSGVSRLCNVEVQHLVGGVLHVGFKGYVLRFGFKATRSSLANDGSVSRVGGEGLVDHDTIVVSKHLECEVGDGEVVGLVGAGRVASRGLHVEADDVSRARGSSGSGAVD